MSDAGVLQRLQLIAGYGFAYQRAFTETNYSARNAEKTGLVNSDDLKELRRGEKMRVSILFLSLIALISCGSTSFTMRETPPLTFEEYTYLPIDKLTNKMLLDELKNKDVRVDADFGYIFYYHDLNGYPSDKWIRISVIKDSIRYENVMVPKSEAEKYFNLLKGEPITIYAKIKVCSLESSSVNRGSDEIVLNVTEIKRRLSKEIIMFPDITGWKLINFRQQDGVVVKTYQNDHTYITAYYESGKPTGFWIAPVPQGQNMTTYCDKDGDGIFETLLTNNLNCYYSGK